MEKHLSIIMIHPTIELVFVDNYESRMIFSSICKKIKRVDGLEEFIRWHLDVNKQVIKEITHTQRIDFSDDAEAKKWARGYLNSYEKKIRKMRHISNQVFERFHELNEGEFKGTISDNTDYEKKIRAMIRVFLNRKGLLIGKIIFAYRETWFLANHIQYPNFNIGTIKKYQEWIDENFSNLIELDKIFRECSRGDFKMETLTVCGGIKA